MYLSDSIRDVVVVALDDIALFDDMVKKQYMFAW